MSQYWTPRQWLQNKADNKQVDENTRAWAKSALNVVGDDWGIDQRFLNHEKYSSPGISRYQAGGRNPFNPKNYSNKSNGYTVSQVRDLLVPSLKARYFEDKAVWEKDSNVANSRNTINSHAAAAGSNAISQWQQLQAMREAEARRKEQENNARNLAYVNDQLRYMPGQLDRINRAERNRLDHIADEYNRSLGYSNRAWQRAQEDHDEDVARRLRTRANRVGVADDDFRKQRDAYDRYFARIGAGSSSVSQYTAPTMLAQAAGKIRNEIEEDNAEQDRFQTINFNRAKEDHEYNLAELARQKARQEAAARSEFDNKRSGYHQELAGLERQRSAYQGKDHNAVIADASASLDRASRLADSAVDAGKLTASMKYRPVVYAKIGPSDWKYEATESKVEENKPVENDMYNKYFRDEEERKKRLKEQGLLQDIGSTR